jgi:hypothetical protein
MVSRGQFWSIMQAYSARIWPIQTVFYIAAILLVGWLFLTPGRIQSFLAKMFLSIAFAWNGIVFYMILAKEMAGGGYGNYFFGFLFLVVSVLLAADAFRRKMQFSLPTMGWQKDTTLVLALLVFSYPFLGSALGHGLTAPIMPGTYPCPTTALALLLLTTALPQVDKVVYILLLFCAIPFTPFFQIARYGVYEDAILFVTGIYSLVMLLTHWRVEKLPA